MIMVLVPLVVFFGVFTQSIAGFGLPLIAMALLIQTLGAATATPLVALITLTLAIILLIRYRGAIKLRVLAQIIGASIIGTPFGIWVVQNAPEDVVFLLLGVALVAYASYSLLNLRLPELQNPAWAYIFGFIAGVLSSAYNLGGPIIVTYGTARRWASDEFKSTMQGFFIIASTIVLIAHGTAGNLTQTVWENYLIALPAIALGVLAGFYMERFINAVMFRRIVLVILIVMGLNLIF